MVLNYALRSDLGIFNILNNSITIIWKYCREDNYD